MTRYRFEVKEASEWLPVSEFMMWSRSESTSYDHDSLDDAVQSLFRFCERYHDFVLKRVKVRVWDTEANDVVVSSFVNQRKVSFMFNDKLPDDHPLSARKEENGYRFSFAGKPDGKGV